MLLACFVSVLGHRPREKVNRPQTRRRRDNTEECLEKLRTIKENLANAKGIVDEIVRRERRKRDLFVSGECMVLRGGSHEGLAQSPGLPGSSSAEICRSCTLFHVKH